MAVRAQWTRSGVVGGREGAVLTRGYISGASELRAALARLEQGMRDEVLAGATLAGGKVLEERWKQMVALGPAPVHYRDAIAASARPGKRGATGIVQVTKLAGVPDDEQPRAYAARLEFGSQRATKQTLASGRTDFASRGRTAQPSLRPAFDACKGEMLDAMADELKRLIAAAT